MKAGRTNLAIHSKADQTIALAIDTSSACASLAVSRNGDEYATLTLVDVRQHSQIVFDHLQMLLRLAEVRVEDVDLFAAITGPGSFTGLRIGLAAMQGIAGGLRRPVAGVTAFDALAGSLGLAGHVVTMIDAGRGEVYCGLRRVGQSGIPVSVGKDFVGPLAFALAQMRSRIPNCEKNVYLLGNGSLRYADELCRLGDESGVRIAGSQLVDLDSGAWSLVTRTRPLAGWAAMAATRLVWAGTNPGLHPYYLKPSDAEVKWKIINDRS